MRGENSRRDYGPPTRVYGKQEGASFQVIVLVSTLHGDKQHDMLPEREQGSETFDGSFTPVSNPLGHVPKQNSLCLQMPVSGHRMNLIQTNLVFVV